MEIILARACAAPAVAASVGTATATNFRHNPSIPLVCRRWADMYVQSAVLWQETRLDWAVVVAQGAQEERGADPAAACAAAARWLSARLPQVHRLLFTGCYALAALPTPLSLHQLFPGSLISPRLREATVLEARGAVGPALPSLFQGCPGLHSLVLACQARAEGPSNALVVHGELLAGLACLPCLSSLDLHVDKIVGSTADVATALAGLTQLSICCRMEAAALDPQLLEGLSQVGRRQRLALLDLGRR